MTTKPLGGSRAVAKYRDQHTGQQGTGECRQLPHPHLQAPNRSAEGKRNRSRKWFALHAVHGPHVKQARSIRSGRGLR
jgi:hypothetical protein